MINIEHQNISMEQLDDSFDLQKLGSIKQKTKPFRFIQFLNQESHRLYHKVKDGFFQQNNRLSINIKQSQSVSMRMDSFLDKKQKNLSEMSTINSSILSQNEERQCIKQIRQNNRKIFLVQMKQNDGKPLNGTGVIKLIDGRIVFGTWHSGVTIGIVKIIYPSGNIYVGDVINYIRHGYGQLCFSNGDKYNGAFFKGNIEGFGKMYCNQTKITIEGIWQNGVYLRK